MAARLASSGFRSLDEALLADGTLPPTSEGIDYMARVLGPCLLLRSHWPLALRTMRGSCMPAGCQGPPRALRWKLPRFRLSCVADALGSQQGFVRGCFAGGGR